MTRYKNKIRPFLITLTTLFALNVHAQFDYQMRANEKGIDVNFLTSYYKQDGNNSAVEGGIGTEELIDGANILIVNIPIDSSKSINFTGGADFYSSASTDKIDANVSSASIKDLRAYFNIGYSQKQLKKGLTYGAKFGLSNEYDYFSLSGGLNLSKEWNRGNSEVNFAAQAFFDNWRTFFPAELRRDVTVPTTQRRSYNISGSYAQVINKKFQIALSTEGIYMTGLLSTPFHRVYFSDASIPDIERLPDNRLKIPISLRANYFLSERMIIRSYYRFYTDNFGIQGHTASIELPFKVSEDWSLSPFFRYHTQSGSKYFAPYKEHLSTEEFYTSDYDLSSLSSKKYGLAIGYYPTFGIYGKNILGQNIMFKSIELRLAYYSRDTGLSAYLGSLNFKFKF